MKKLLQISAFALLSATFFTSCGTDAPKVETITVDASGTRGVQTVMFQGEAQKVAVADIIVAQNKKANAEQDAQFIAGIFNNLQAAENKAAMLDVQLTLSEEKVADGTFVFAIDAPAAENLTIELFDEEGFALAGANKMDVTSGKNYKAINVKALNDGQYVMRLRNADGKELVQNFVIAAAK